MTFYSVYEPPEEAPDLLRRAERLTFVKEGFSWPALLVPALWLLYQRMWLELILFIVIFVLLGWAIGPAEEGQPLLGWMSFAIVLLFAFEANDLRAASLERRGFRVTGVAIDSDRDAAELAFLRSWLPQQQKATPGRDAPERPNQVQVDTSNNDEGDEVIGLFPRA